MRVFMCEGLHPTYLCDWDLDATEIVVANTKSEALGLCLSHYKESKASWWSIKEVDTNKFGFYEER